MEYHGEKSYISRRKFLKCLAGASVYGLIKTTEPVSSATEKKLDYPIWGFPRIATFKEIVGVNNPRTEMFQYSNNPMIYVLDFGGVNGLRQQAMTINRLDVLTSRKDAPKDRVLNNDELIKFIEREGANRDIFALGFCSCPEDWMKLYNLAETQEVCLNEEEIQLN